MVEEMRNNEEEWNNNMIAAYLNACRETEYTQSRNVSLRLHIRIRSFANFFDDTHTHTHKKIS